MSQAEQPTVEAEGFEDITAGAPEVGTGETEEAVAVVIDRRSPRPP